MNTTIKKERKNHKIRNIILVIIAAAILTGIALYYYNFMYDGRYHGPMYSSDEEVYQYFAEAQHDSICYDMSQYDGLMEEIKKNYLAMSDDCINAVEDAKPLPEKFDSIADEGNEMLIGFFRDNYGISVEEELAEMEVMYADLDSIGATGIYFLEAEGINDGNVIYLNDDLTDYDPGDGDDSTIRTEVFYGTYIHEALHYLGSCNKEHDETAWSDLIEGITEALTEDVITYGGYRYSDTSAYVLNTRIAKQLIEVSPDLIVKMIEGNGYISIDELNDHIDSVSMPGMGQAMERTVSLVMNDTMNRKYQRMAQHIMGEYLKGHELSREQQIELADMFIAPISKLER